MARQSSSDRQTVTIYGDYGYDWHSVEVDEATFQRIKSGETVSVTGQGFLYDEWGWFIETWVFNDASGETRFYLDNGAEFFIRKWETET